MRWQKALWDAVGKYDVDLVKAILAREEVKSALSSSSSSLQVYRDEEAPLHLAAFCGHNDVIAILLDGGIDVDSYNVYSDKSGFKVTALHFAVYKNKVSTVKFLLCEGGADPSLHGRWGKVEGTPLDFARKRKQKEMVEILEEYELSDDEYVTDPDDDEEEEEAILRLSSLEFSLSEAESRRNELQEELAEANMDVLHLRRKLNSIKHNTNNSNSSNNSSNSKEDKDCNVVVEEESMGDINSSKNMEDKEDNMEESKDRKNMDMEDDLDKVKTVCPVCFCWPRYKIFSCTECDNILCHGCRSKVMSCPCCRVNFEEKEPRRNRWAERLVALQRKVL